jgi:hypothetical protein
VDVQRHVDVALELGVAAVLVELEVEPAVARDGLRQVQLDAR